MAAGKEIYLDGWIDSVSRLLSEPNGPFDNIQERYKSVLIKKLMKIYYEIILLEDLSFSQFFRNAFDASNNKIQ